MLLPSCIRSKPLLMWASGKVWVIIGSISIFFCIYQSTIFGTSVRPRAPPKAVPRQERPVGDLLARTGDADDDALAPAAVAALERRAHQVNVADALEGVVGAADLVGAALGHVDK